MRQATELPRLSAQVAPAPTRPEKILQFGTGNFLRAFADWMIDGLNRQGLFDGSIVVVQATPRGLAGKFNEQDGRYTVLVRGIENGQLIEKQQVIASVSRAIDPYTDFDAFLACARNPDLRFIISNTTEAGIVYDPADLAEARPPAGFPGKLTRFLLERYRSYPDRGFVIVPCELIDCNSEKLRQAVLETARGWQLEREFLDWITSANVFAGTLVDRIVPGYPHDEAAAIANRLGYRDELLVASESFHFWAIEAPGNVARELPLAAGGFNVVFADDIAPYRERKVRILNGSHTSVALAAYLSGRNTVKECMDDPVLREYVETLLRVEIAPKLTLPQQEVNAFISSTLDRFSNPYLRHLLLSISLNSVSKYRARLLPLVLEHMRASGEAPLRLTFALAALIAFYRGTAIRNAALIGHRNDEEYEIRDELPILQTFADIWSHHADSPAAVTDAVLSQTGWWGCDLRDTPGLSAAVTAHLTAILIRGAYAAVADLRSAASSTSLA
jgi:tagaturonate reductase